MESDDKALVNFYIIFEERDGVAIDMVEVRTLARSMGFNDDEINAMMEHLLDNGLIHEPIQGYFASTRCCDG